MKKIFMASIALTTFAVCSMLFQLTSCKKAVAQPSTTCPAATYQVAGLWTGTFTVNTLPAQGSLFYSFVIYADGRILTESKSTAGISYYCAGTWTLSSANVFSATITSFVTPGSGLPVTQSITATYSNTGKLTDATWKDTNNPNGTALSGKFSTMQRVN